MIYLDSAATSLHKPPQVARAVAEAIGSFGNPARGAHAAALAADRAVYETRRELAALLGCPRPDHVILTCNATEALNIAIYGLLGPGDRAVSTDLEHNSVLRPLYDLQAKGMELAFAPADARGRLDYEALDRLILPGTRAVICNHASNLNNHIHLFYCLCTICEIIESRSNRYYSFNCFSFAFLQRIYFSVFYLCKPPRRRGSCPLTWRPWASTYSASPATRALWGPRAPAASASARGWSCGPSSGAAAGSIPMTPVSRGNTPPAWRPGP